MQFGIADVEGLTIAAGLAQGCPQAGRTIAGDADEAGLLVERTADGLADPERGVGGELEATAPVELVDGVLEAQVAFLDEVEEIHALGEGIAASDAHHEAQVGANEAILGFSCLGDGGLQCCALLASGEAIGRFATCLDDAGELALLFRIEQRHFSDVVQVQSD